MMSANQLSPSLSTPVTNLLLNADYLYIVNRKLELKKFIKEELTIGFI